MKIIVHWPSDQIAAEELARRIATIHAESVLHNIQQQPISRKDRIKLLETILKQK